MLLRQLFDHDTYTYTYLLGCERTGEAAIIDPVVGNVDHYLQLIKELGLTLKVALDTHVHADHITALGKLRELTQCATRVGNKGDVDCADDGLEDGGLVMIGDIDISVIYTPGHTNDSYCFHVSSEGNGLIFSGDTLLIRGNGRTDFQNGDAGQLFDSLHSKLMLLPDSTIVCPGHDYKGNTVSSIGEERLHNPRLQIKERADFIEFMGNLKLANPKYMDVAVPANLACGKG
ncbi:MAG: MBL fold metallo-hydrolase [Sinobacterium sp.]|nr:MBL fold metallo-hydrolase [Sinobacterium sp.]